MSRTFSKVSKINELSNCEVIGFGAPPRKGRQLSLVEPSGEMSVPILPLFPLLGRAAKRAQLVLPLDWPVVEVFLGNRSGKLPL
jgi:hypothetical protein